MKNKEYIKLRAILGIVSLYLIGLMFPLLFIFDSPPCEIGKISKECAIAGIVTGIYTLVFIIAFSNNKDIIPKRFIKSKIILSQIIQNE